MSRHIFKLPDLGEGTVSAEIIAWHVKAGDQLKEDQPLVEMSTDKAVVEIPSPVSGRVLSITGKPGDVIAVGAELATFDTADTGSAISAAPAVASAVPEPRPRRGLRQRARPPTPRSRRQAHRSGPPRPLVGAHRRRA